MKQKCFTVSVTLEQPMVNDYSSTYYTTTGKNAQSPSSEIIFINCVFVIFIVEPWPRLQNVITTKLSSPPDILRYIYTRFEGKWVALDIYICYQLTGTRPWQVIDWTATASDIGALLSLLLLPASTGFHLLLCSMAGKFLIIHLCALCYDFRCLIWQLGHRSGIAYDLHKRIRCHLHKFRAVLYSNSAIRFCLMWLNYLLWYAN